MANNRAGNMASKQTTGLKPGTPAPASGEYQIRGVRGGHGPERTSDIHKPLPPTPLPGQTFSSRSDLRPGSPRP